jgi:hypothetical protein
MPDGFANRRAGRVPKNRRWIPHFPSLAASHFIWVDFPQPSEPLNVISGMATVLR